MKLIKIYCFICFLTLFGCRETHYNYDCGLAPSTPTDLMITNNTNQEVDLILKVREDKLSKFKSLSLSPDEKKSICIEYEGPITDGVYVEFNEQTDVIELKALQANEFTLRERKLK